MDKNLLDLEQEDIDIDEDDLKPWQLKLRAFVFPTAHRQLIRKNQPEYQELDKKADWFEYLSLAVIGLNMVAMAADDPTDLNKTSTRTKVLRYADYVFITFFTIEVTLRMMAFGVKHFVSQSWNILDTFVVAAGLLSVLLASSELDSLSGLRAVRVLRPLRTVTKLPSVKLVVLAMLGSLADLVDVSILFLLFLFSFSAAGVAQFSGHFRNRCVRNEFDNVTDFFVRHPQLEFLAPNVSGIESFVCGEVFDSMVLNETSIGCNPDQLCYHGSALLEGYKCPYGYSCREVHNPYYGFVGFDNLAQAALTVQAIVSLELFPDALYFSVDSTNITASIYCVVIVVFGTFFIINLLVAVITVGFRKCHEEETAKRETIVTEKPRTVRAQSMLEKTNSFFRTVMLSQHQRVRRWHEEQAQPQEQSPTNASEERENSENAENLTGVEKVRAFVHTKILQSPIFIWSTTVLILLSVAIMATEYHGMPSHVIEAYDHVTLAFTILITIEVFVRFIGTTPILFILDVGNFMGVIVVVVSWVDYALEDFRLPAIRSLRIVIAIKLVQQFPSIYKWFLIMLKAFRASVVVLFIMFLDIFIFACLGMQLFGGKFCGMDPDGVDGWCDDRPRLNFDAFGAALLTSFQLMTGDDWNIVMYDGMRAAGEGYALLFVAHHFIAVYILVNLFIAILIDASENFQEDIDQRINMKHHGIGIATNGSDSDDLELIVAEQEEQDEAAKKVREEAAERDEFYDAYPVFRERMPWKERLRNIAKYIVTHKLTVAFVLCTIALSTITLSLDSPVLPPDSRRVATLRIIDLACTSVFIAECALQIAAYGFFMTPRSYLRRSKWNILDFLLVLCGILDMWLSQSDAKEAIRVAKILYVLRPLRVLRRSPGIQVVTKSLLAALPAIKDVLIVALIFWTCFAIAGVQLFKGEFYSCSEPEYTTKQNCTSSGHRWVNKPLHFDHFGAAMISLFVISTFEGWSPVMHSGIDAVGPDESPRLNNNPMAALYFVIFAVLGGFFLVNLFISVLINTYEQEKKRLQKKSMFLTDEQQEWLGCQLMLFKAIPLEDYLVLPNEDEIKKLSLWSQWRVRTMAFTMHPRFAKMIYGFIIVNAVAAGADHYPILPSVRMFFFVLNVTITGIFALEAALKMFALTPVLYFRSHWNGFDFMVVVVSILGLIIQATLGRTWSFASALRTLRCIRLAINPKNKRQSLAVVVKKFIISLYALNNVAALVILFITLFALLGMALFGRLRRDGSVITHNANFENFPQAALMLFRVMTGGQWPLVMRACRQVPDECDPNIGECGKPIAAPIMFILFLVVATYMLLNIFVAVMMDYFSNEQNNERHLSSEDAKVFIDHWVKRDPNRMLKLHCSEIFPLVKELPAEHPFFFKPRARGERVRFSEMAYLWKLDLTAYGGYVDFFDFIISLTRVALGGKFTDAMVVHLRRKFDKCFAFTLKHRPTSTGEPMNVAEWYAAQVLLEAYRSFVAAKRRTEAQNVVIKKRHDEFMSRVIPVQSSGSESWKSKQMKYFDDTPEHDARTTASLTALDAKLRELDREYEIKATAHVEAAKERWLNPSKHARSERSDTLQTNRTTGQQATNLRMFQSSGKLLTPSRPTIDQVHPNQLKQQDDPLLAML